MDLRSAAEQVSPPGPLQIRFTHEDKRFQRGQEPSRPPRRDYSEGTIELDPSCTFQEILGAALTDAACYLQHQLSPSKRQEFLREIFDPGAIGLNACRICIGSRTTQLNHTATQRFVDTPTGKRSPRPNRAG